MVRARDGELAFLPSSPGVVFGTLCDFRKAGGRKAQITTLGYSSLPWNRCFIAPPHEPSSHFSTK